MKDGKHPILSPCFTGSAPCFSRVAAQLGDHLPTVDSIRHREAVGLGVRMMTLNGVQSNAVCPRPQCMRAEGHLRVTRLAAVVDLFSSLAA